MTVPAHGCPPFYLESPAYDFGAYFNSSEFSDMTIIAGDETIHCHKIVLVSRIPYFRKMFACDNTLEKVELKGVADVSQLKEILKWAYTGKITISVEKAAELLSSSCYFQIYCICEKSVEYILRNKSAFKSDLIDVFLTAAKNNFNELAQVTRGHVLNKLLQVTNDDKFLNMTPDELKTLLFYEGTIDIPKSIARGDVSKTSQGKMLRLKIIVHPKHLLMAIMKWIRTHENRVTFATELLNLVNLMEIPKAEVEMFCDNFVKERGDCFRPILHRLSMDDDEARLNPRSVKKMGKRKLFYVQTYRHESIVVHKKLVKLGELSQVGNGLINAHFAMLENRSRDNIIGFGVENGYFYFLLNYNQSYELYKLVTVGYLHYSWEKVALPFKEVSVSKILICVMENWTDGFTLFSDFGRNSYISSLCSNENAWITYQLDGHKNFLSQYADDVVDGYLTLCDTPVWKIPHPLGMAASDPVESACSLAGNEIYVFFGGSQLPQVFDVENRKWRQLPEKPGFREPYNFRVLDVDGKVVVFVNDHFGIVVYEFDGEKWRCLQRMHDRYGFVAVVDSEINDMDDAPEDPDERSPSPSSSENE